MHIHYHAQCDVSAPSCWVKSQSWQSLDCSGGLKSWTLSMISDQLHRAFHTPRQTCSSIKRFFYSPIMLNKKYLELLWHKYGGLSWIFEECGIWMRELGDVVYNAGQEHSREILPSSAPCEQQLWILRRSQHIRTVSGCLKVFCEKTWHFYFLLTDTVIQLCCVPIDRGTWYVSHDRAMGNTHHKCLRILKW